MREIPDVGKRDPFGKHYGVTRHQPVGSVIPVFRGCIKTREPGTSFGLCHFFSIAVQWRTTVMGEITVSVATLTRKRLPSRLGT